VLVITGSAKVELRRASMALFVSVFCGSVLSTASAADMHQRVIRHRYRLAKGVTLTRIRYPDAPNEVRVVTLSQGHQARNDILPAGPEYPAYKLPSVMAWNAGAIAAVNDDFSVEGRPKHLSMIDGELWTSGLQRGVGLGFSADGTRAFAGAIERTITATPAGGASFDIARWNAGAPRRDQVGAYSLRGGTKERPPGRDPPTSTSPRWCAARLVPAGRITWMGAKRDKLGRDYVVDAQPEPCPKTPIHMGSVSGTVALAAHASRSGGSSIKALESGQAIRLRWFLQGWPRVVDVIGGTPQLVDNGRNVGPPFHPGDPYIFGLNPRTAVGVNKACEDATRDTRCKTFIVTVDGRQSGWSRGMRFPDLGRLFIRLGAYDAVNLDGGGSTEAWVRRRRPVYCERPASVGGCFANRPSDPGERQAVMSLVVLPNPDSGDPPR
jgi:hypothetical protein